MRNLEKTLTAMINDDAICSAIDSVKVDAITTETTTEDVIYTINVFHYLKKQLAFDKFTEKVNNKLAKIRKNEDTKYDAPHWDGECMEWLKTDLSFTDYADMIEHDNQCNTYNYDTNLSHVLQYTMFNVGSDYYLFLCVHNGGDVRGNYSSAVCFKLDNEYCYDNGYLNPESVYGEIDGVQVSNVYDGLKLRDDVSGDDNFVHVTADSVFSLDIE
jgi:hypothetical protein